MVQTPHHNQDALLETLTSTERKVLKWIGYGKTIGEIADLLHRTRKTVETHRTALGHKLGASNQVGLARIAIQLGLSPLSDTASRQLAITQEGSPGSNHPALQALHEIDQGTNGITGLTFFRVLVRHLASALQVAYVYVSEHIRNPPDTFRFIACWPNDLAPADQTYPIKGTPCEDLVRGNVLLFPKGIRQTYSSSPFLEAINAEGYIGSGLFNAAGDSIGVLAAVHHEPLEFSYPPDLILRLFASRTAAELERIQTEDKLRETKQKYRLLVDQEEEQEDVN